MNPTIYHPCPLSLTKGKPYTVDDDGNIYNRRCKRLKPRRWRHFRPSSSCHSQYLFVGDDLLAHRVICAAVYGPPLPGQVCDHLDGNIFNNHPSNLQWVTPAENRRRARILRTLRAQALATNRPDLLPQNMRPDDLLALFTQNNLAGDCYEGE